MKVKYDKKKNLKIECSADVHQLMQKILMRQNKLHRQKEYFWVIGLNNASNILYIELVSIGSLNKCIVDPVEVFCFAIARKCKRIIMVHNHPSGNPEPSDSDLSITAQLVKGASYLNIQIVDHIIITEKKYMSFADQGLRLK
jgi:DNA repair protein RadC